jgi:uncharacterized protein YjeT (DUF2065 family)
MEPSMSPSLQQAVALAFVIVGLSHLLHGRRWAQFFEPIFQNDGGPFLIAILTLPIGLVLVFAHNVWSWDGRVLLTLYGWCATIKGTLYFLVPALPQRLATKRIRQPRHFAYAGLVLLAWGLLMGCDAVLGS